MNSNLLIIFQTLAPKGENTESPIDHNSMVLGDSDNNVYLHVSEEIHTGTYEVSPRVQNLK